MGKRGPKPGAVYEPTKQKALMRQVIRDLVEKNLPQMVAAQLAAATGTKYLVTRGPDGKFTKVTEAMAGALKGDEIIEVWEEKPSHQAFQAIIDHAIDKAPAHVELTGEGGGPVEIVNRLSAARTRLAKSRD